jgi:hypothetical protein
LKPQKLLHEDLWSTTCWKLKIIILIKNMGKGKAVPLQAWSGPEGSRKLRFPDFMTTAQDGGKVVRLKHRPHLPQKITWYSFLLEVELTPGSIKNMGTLPIQSGNCLQFSSHTVEVANFMLFILCVFLP